MIRVHGWDTSLIAWANENRGKGFRWGQTDCAVMVRKALKLMYGTDPLDLATWKTKGEALAALDGLTDPADPLRDAGAEAVPLAFLQSGDVLVDPDSSDRLAAYAIAVTPGQVLTSDIKRGVIIAPVDRSSGFEAWRFPNGPGVSDG